MVIEVAAALVLLVGAGLMLKTLARLRAIDIGFQSDHLLTMGTVLPRNKYREPARRLAFYDRVMEGVRALPGVESAAYNSTLPFLSTGNTQGYTVEGRQLPPGEPGDALLRVGDPQYLKTLGVRVIEGRLPDSRDSGECAADHRDQRDAGKTLVAERERAGASHHFERADAGLANRHRRGEGRT